MFDKEKENPINKILKETSWIGETLKNGLEKKHKNILMLGPGNGEELVHIRNIMGSKANITAVDNGNWKSKDVILNLAGIAKLTKAKLIIEDYRISASILRIMKKNLPSLIVARNPQIHDRPNPQGGFDIINNDIVRSLVNYAKAIQIISQGTGNMLITFALEVDKNLVTKELDKEGVEYSDIQTTPAPEHLHHKAGSADFIFDQFGIMI